MKAIPLRPGELASLIRATGDCTHNNPRVVSFSFGPGHAELTPDETPAAAWSEEALHKLRARPPATEPIV